MTYPRNSANPPTFDVGQVVQISDGVVQSSGVSVQVKVGTGSFGAGAGTLAYDSNTGIWNYTPTQGETDAETFIVQIYKTGCYSASVTVSTDDGTTNVTKIAGQATSASAPVSFPASVANESTVASIPTNPLTDDVVSEIGQLSPPSSTSLSIMIRYLYKSWRNRKSQTETQYSLYADDGVTVDQKATVSDDGTTTTIGEIEAGP